MSRISGSGDLGLHLACQSGPKLGLFDEFVWVHEIRFSSTELTGFGSSGLGAAAVELDASPPDWLQLNWTRRWTTRPSIGFSSTGHAARRRAFQLDSDKLDTPPDGASSN
jgi:hypothetical protein